MQRDIKSREEATEFTNTARATHSRVMAKIDSLNKDCKGIKQKMHGNIEKQLENMRKGEELDEQSARLLISAEKFGGQSKSLRRKMYWQKVKFYVLAAVGVTVATGGVAAAVAL